MTAAARLACGLSLSLLMSGGVMAADEFAITVLPHSPAAERPFQLNVTTTSTSPCAAVPDGLQVKRISDRVVRFELSVPDYCAPPPPVTSRTFTAPPLPSGEFTFDFALCTNAPPPLDPCHSVSQQAIVVGAGVAPSEIPASQDWMLPGVIGAFAVMGWSVLRRA